MNPLQVAIEAAKDRVDRLEQFLMPYAERGQELPQFLRGRYVVASEVHGVLLNVGAIVIPMLSKGVCVPSVQSCILAAATFAMAPDEEARRLHYGKILAALDCAVREAAALGIVVERLEDAKLLLTQAQAAKETAEAELRRAQVGAETTLAAARSEFLRAQANKKNKKAEAHGRESLATEQKMLAKADYNRASFLRKMFLGVPAGAPKKESESAEGGK
jgi:hypothetical protein